MKQIKVVHVPPEVKEQRRGENQTIPDVTYLTDNLNRNQSEDYI